MVEKRYGASLGQVYKPTLNVQKEDGLKFVPRLDSVVKTLPLNLVKQEEDNMVKPNESVKGVEKLKPSYEDKNKGMKVKENANK